MVSTQASLAPVFPVDFFRDCISKAQELKNLIALSQIPELATPPPTYNGPIPDLHLPFPHDILLSVDDMALPGHIADQMKSKIAEKILQSQRACTENYRETCRGLPEKFVTADYLQNLANMYRDFFDKHQMTDFRRSISASKATLVMVNRNHKMTLKRPAFNAEYTPILERYFECNAYPSRPDRVLLAQKSSMSERQIEVWFQNHRNRSKKEGIPLKRMSPQQSLPTDILGQKTSTHDIPPRAPFPSRSDTHILVAHKISEALPLFHKSFPNLTHNPSVFPNPYRPNFSQSDVHSLPIQDTARFPPPNWPRKSTTESPSPPSINMEEFINIFASKLSIRRGLGSKTVYGSSGTQPWFFSTVTIPPPAPHPALIRTTISIYPSSPTPFWSAIRSIPMTISYISSISRPSTPSRSKRFSRPRKAAPFPFRSPQKSLRMRPAKTSLPAFERYSSRTISFTSVSSASSTQSRTSSDSSRSSPGPTTPPQSPSHNAVEINDPFAIEVHEPAPSDSYDDIFAGIADPHFADLQNLDNFLNNGVMYTDKYIQDSLNFPFSDPQYATA